MHGEEVGQHLRGVALVSQPVVDRHPSVLDEASTSAWLLPRNSIASYMRPNTAAVSAGTAGHSQLPRPVLVEAQHLRIAESGCDPCPPVHRGARGADGRGTVFYRLPGVLPWARRGWDKSVQAYPKGRKHVVILTT
jgi:hypothetical protein